MLGDHTWPLTGETENGKQKMALTETDGNRNSVSVRFHQAVLAELYFHLF